MKDDLNLLFPPCFVSVTSVWKLVDFLKKKGVEIKKDILPHTYRLKKGNFIAYWNFETNSGVIPKYHEKKDGTLAYVRTDLYKDDYSEFLLRCVATLRQLSTNTERIHQLKEDR